MHLTKKYQYYKELDIIIQLMMILVMLVNDEDGLLRKLVSFLLCFSCWLDCFRLWGKQNWIILISMCSSQLELEYECGR
ncbi:hypothetical protein M6B38_289335 [Iris pallida]|uniref:Uncharacterized protein n=1 Tax=Iris pallida TaxID=29817 RepID=A0AAX6HXE2_IRIPA|nr:hypothetical protein M6B38_289335 [Iris pallida]